MVHEYLIIIQSQSVVHTEGAPEKYDSLICFARIEHQESNTRIEYHESTLSLSNGNSFSNRKYCNRLSPFRVCEGLDVDMEQGIILPASNGPVTLNVVSNKGNADASFYAEFTVSDKAPTAPSGMIDFRFQLTII